jgi:hypothetical protein
VLGGELQRLRGQLLSDLEKTCSIDMIKGVWRLAHAAKLGVKLWRNQAARSLKWDRACSYPSHGMLNGICDACLVSDNASIKQL